MLLSKNWIVSKERLYCEYDAIICIIIMTDIFLDCEYVQM